ARTAQFNIAYTPDQVAGKAAPAIRGSHTFESALGQALEGTGLGFVRTPNGSYLLVRAVAKAPVKPVASAPLPTVTEDKEEITEVVVVGYRNSLDRSATLKSRSAGFLDSIVAEDVLKFPDSNLAEAVQRISGVAISRDQGEGRSITVRGLGPEFSRVLINDFEAQASTDGLVGGLNRGRGFDFNVFPSELFSRIDVRKSATADDPGASIGATINLITPKPFDFRGRRVSFSAQGSYNDLSQRSGSRYSAMYADRFAGGRLGALVALAHSEAPLEIQGVNSGGWSEAQADGGFCPPTVGTGGICDVAPEAYEAALSAYSRISAPQVHHPRFYRYTDLIGRVSRTGAIASVQWRPRETSYLSLNILASRYETRRTDYFLEAIGFSRGGSQGGKPETLVRSVSINADGSVIGGEFDNVDVRSEVIIDNFRTDFLRTSLLYKEKVSERFRFDLAWAASRSRFDNFEDLNIQIDRFNVDGYRFDAGTYGMRRPVISYGFDVQDANSWYFGPPVAQPGGTGAVGPEIRFRPNAVDNSYDVWKLRTYYGVSRNAELGAGVEYNAFRFASSGQRFVNGDSGFPAPDAPLSALTKAFCGLGEMSPPDGTPRCWRVPDAAAFIAYYDLYGGKGQAALSASIPTAQGQNQQVDENETAAYVRLKFKTYVWGKTLTGNAGVRWVHTRQTSRYFINRDAGGVLISDFVTSERSYTDALPSASMSVKLNAKRYLRLGLASVVAKPPLASLSGGATVEVNGGRRQVVLGNPDIKAIRADSFDIAQEFYGDTGELFSIGLFHKRFRNYIQNRTYIAPYAQSGLPAAYLSGTGLSVDDEFSISQYVNTPGGRLTGVELYYQGRLGSLHDRLRDFGVNLSYTFVDSAVEYQTTDYVTPATMTGELTHASRSSYNATLFFDRNGLEGRVSVNYRDAYLTSVPGAFGADASGIEPATYVDAALTY
ncbi:MAG: TonB-dependent receptor, partial [Asticcacaulis sp.]